LRIRPGRRSGAKARDPGNRPSFTEAADPELAERLYEHFCGVLAGTGVAVSRGIFGARMEVALVNDGPVTIVLDA